MADIFISYSNEDAARVRLLAALLEGEGYSVWWDTSLLSGDNFRKKIMTELGQARVVIVLWTNSSIASDWVQSEAGRAHANRNLIPVKDRGLNYQDIPPPFDNMHIGNVDDEEGVLAAVTAQMARPESLAPIVTQISRKLRYQILTWIGIAGGALSLFTNVGSLLKLSAWAQWVVDYWLDWTRDFWAWISSIVQVRFPPYVQLDMTFLLFVLTTAIASHINYNMFSGKERLPLLKFQYLLGIHTIFAIIWFQAYFAIFSPYLEKYLWENNYSQIAFEVITNIVNMFGTTAFVFLLVFRWPRVAAINTAFALGLIATIFFTAAFHRNAVDSFRTFGENIPILTLSIAAMLVAAPVFFHRRIWYMLSFFILLVIGNEVAKLGWAL